MWITGLLEIIGVVALSVIIIYGRATRKVLWMLILSVILGGIIAIKSKIGSVDEKGSVIEILEKGGLENRIEGLIYIGSGLCICSSIRRIGKDGDVELSSIILLSVIGLGIMISGKDLLTIYLGLELQGLSMYIIAGYKKDSAYGSEGGLKYYIIGTIGSGLLLLGIGQIYYTTGTIVLEEIGRIYNVDDYAIDKRLEIGIKSIIIGISIKLGGAPFHGWVADVYEGARIWAGKYMAIIGKLGLIGILYKILKEIPTEVWKQEVSIIGGISMIIGSIGALYQRRVKRFIGYSGIGHVGWMLVGLSINTEEGLRNTLMYIIVYMITTYGIFEIIEKERIEYIEEIRRVIKERQGVGIGLVILMMSLGGLPLMGGFFVKMGILLSCIKEGMLTIVIIGGVLSILSIYNYIRWIKEGYTIQRKSEKRTRRKERTWKEGRGLGIGILGILGYICIGGIWI